MNSHGASTKAGLTAVLAALALLLALQLPSSGLTGSGNSTVAASSSTGRLLVGVALENDSLAPAPLRGVQVGITQAIIHGLHLVLPTNRSGEAEFTVPAGVYGVSVGNSKFALFREVPVYSSNLTSVNVIVNRTAYIASFAEAEDSTTQGDIEPWNSVVVEVTPFRFPILLNPGNLPGQLVIVSSVPASPSPLTINGTVFVQAVSLYSGSGGTGIAGGPEVKATVVSQVVGPGGTWLTLRPTGLLHLGGSSYLQVVSYQAGSTVSFENA